jgi:ribonuclease J
VIDLMGLPSKTKRGEPLSELLADTVGAVLDGLSKPRRRDSDAVEQAVERAIRSTVQNIWGKKPACHVLVIEV